MHDRRSSEAPDADLLERFRTTRGADVFGALVSRHGPMVFKTCLRILGDHHAAEDAAQAVFLLLAQGPGRARGSLPAWLHEVARRTSLRLLRTRRRRTRHEQEARRMSSPDAAVDPSLRADLDRALQALPLPLREAVVLRYLEDRPQEECARLAGCPQGTLAWRAAEGLSRLRRLLAAGGAPAGGAALAALLAAEAHATVPAQVLAGLQAAALPAAPGAAAALAKDVARELLWSKLAAPALGAAGLVLAAATVAAFAAGPAQEPPRPPATAVARPASGAAYNITLVTDNAPDFTDVDAFLRSITAQHETPQDKAIAVWRWAQRLRKQAGHPTEDGIGVTDPIAMFTSYGYTMCGLVSGTLNALWLKLGWKARYVQLGDHTVSECSWDDGRTWHMFDASMSFFCFNAKGEVASTEEIAKNPEYYLRNFAPGVGTNPVRGLDDHQGWRSSGDRPVEYKRTLASGVDSFLPPNQLNEDHLAARWGRTYAIHLRPGEHYTRHFDNLDAPKPDPRYHLGAKDPEGSFNKCIRATGVWRYAPDLTDPSTRLHVYDEKDVRWTPQGVRGPGRVTFKVSAANVATSATAAFRATGATWSVSRDAGLTWSPPQPAASSVDLFELVAGAYEFLVRVELDGPAALLGSVQIDTLTQINRPSLPSLTRGANRVQLRLGRQVETLTLVPPILDGRSKETTFEEHSMEANPKPYFNVAALRAAAPGEAYLTWKISAPTPVVDAVYGGNITVKSSDSHAALLHSWDGRTYTEDYRKADGAHPWDLMAIATAKDAPPQARDVYLRYRFERSAKADVWRAPGLQTAIIQVHHRPRVSDVAPVEVTYCWVEHRPEGDVERRHTERVAAFPHEYAINVAGDRDPTMKWVRLNLAGHGPDAKLGYSDGQDVGPGAERPRVTYRWGRNRAADRPYTLEGRVGEKNPDGGRDLTDGVIAPPDTYVSVKWMPTNVIFEKGAAPVITVDLGETGPAAAVRVHAGQELDFKLTFPDAIEVETSVDGRTFAKAGRAVLNQVFDPPADFVPWECDEAAQFDPLPGKGRLAYAYRILLETPVQARFVRVSCRPRPDWAVMLSEIEVFDAVQVDRDLPPPVALPELPKRRSG